jgi:hypothetical protein
LQLLDLALDLGPALGHSSEVGVPPRGCKRVT